MIPDDVRALIFDCDGTLVDTMPAHFASWREVLGAHGLVLEEERFYALAGAPAVEIIAELAKEQGVLVDPRALTREKNERYLARPVLGPPIAPIVAIARGELGRRGLAVASGNFTEVVRRTLRGAAIEDLFGIVVGADQVERGKPAPDVFLRAASLLDIPPSACLVYEDGELGLEAARAAGMRSVDVRPLIQAARLG